MKKIFTLLFMLAIFSLSTSAQMNVYHPMPDSNAMWRVNYWSNPQYCSGNVTGPTSEYQYFISGDTTIGVMAYHKLYKSGVCTDTFGGSNDVFGQTFNLYVGAYRNDTAAKNVYFIHPTDINEYLWYDFNLNVGDTSHNNVNINYSNKVVTAIDSVLVGAVYHKRFTFQGYQCQIIEGVGSTGDLILNIGFFEEGGYLLCFSQNGNPSYPDTATVCNEITTSVREINMNKDQFEIYPNPATNTLTISNSRFANNDLRINDVTGREVYHQTNNSSQSTIDVSNWSRGVYIIWIMNDKETIQRKIVVEK